MSISIKWGLIALVALATSFTAKYSMYDPQNPQSTLPYLITGLAALFASILISLVLNRRHFKNEFTAKKGLQEGMKTGLFAIIVYAMYVYFYLSVFNPSIIENLIATRVEEIKELAYSEEQQKEAISSLMREVTPFRRMTQELLILLSIASSSTLFGTIIVKKFPI